MAETHGGRSRLWAAAAHQGALRLRKAYPGAGRAAAIAVSN